MNLSVNPYKGSRDFYPEDKQIFNYITGVWHQTSRQFGFAEYGAPLVEPLELYKAKSGTELASEQTYAFVDRGGREVAIRPEMTPSVCRMVAARQQQLSFPARLYSIANFMRYERPQKGREREFWQLNADIFGDDSTYAELEIINLSHQIMLNFRADETMFIIKINDRRLVDLIFKSYLELDANQSRSLAKLLDRQAKLSVADFEDQLEAITAEPVTLEKIHQLIKLQQISDLPAEIAQTELATNLQTLLDQLRAIGINNCQFDLSLMRGLDYYTGTVFEIFDTSPNNNRSLFGGGRYDGLVGLFGGENISAVGVAPGMSTLLEFLKIHNLLPKLAPETSVAIMVLDQESIVEATKLANQLRQANINLEVDASQRKLGKRLATLSKKQIKQVIFVGQDEVRQRKFKLKNLATSGEMMLTAAQLLNRLKNA